MTAEEFIKAYTKRCSNETTIYGSHEPWLTPDEALRAVEIAREEVIEKVCEYLEPKIWTMNMGDQKVTDECIEDFKQAMKYEQN